MSRGPPTAATSSSARCRARCASGSARVWLLCICVACPPRHLHWHVLMRRMFLSAQVHIYDALGSYMLNLTLFAGEEGEPITIAGVDWCESIPSGTHARTHTHTHSSACLQVCVRARIRHLWCARACVARASRFKVLVGVAARLGAIARARVRERARPGAPHAMRCGSDRCGCGVRLTLARCGRLHLAVDDAPWVPRNKRGRFARVYGA